MRKAEARQIVRKSRAKDHWHIYDNSKYYSHDGFMDDFKRTAPSTSSIRGIPVDSRGREKRTMAKEFISSESRRKRTETMTVRPWPVPSWQIPAVRHIHRPTENGISSSIPGP